MGLTGTSEAYLGSHRNVISCAHVGCVPEIANEAVFVEQASHLHSRQYFATDLRSQAINDVERHSACMKRLCYLKSVFFCSKQYSFQGLVPTQMLTNGIEQLELS